MTKFTKRILSVLGQSRHGEQWSPWNATVMAHVPCILILVPSVVSIPLFVSWWLPSTLSVEVRSYGSSQWCVIAVASCLPILRLIPYMLLKLKQAWPNYRWSAFSIICWIVKLACSSMAQWIHQVFKSPNLVQWFSLYAINSISFLNLNMVSFQWITSLAM